MKICLVGHDVSGLYGSGTGGAERQISLLARHLAQRGHEVIFVVVGYDGPETTIDGVSVRSGWLPGHGVRGIRYLTYRFPTLRQALRKIAADVYYTRGGGFFTYTVIKIARQMGAVALLGIAHDLDLYIDHARAHFSVGNGLLTSMIAPFAYKLSYVPALQSASCIVVQNEAQAARCTELKLPHQLIPNIVEYPPDDLLASQEDLDVVWIGNIRGSYATKGFFELIDLIKSVPDLCFGIAGDISDTSLISKIGDIKQSANVHYFGSLSHAETLKVIARSKIVINTSPSEGFSNVILEGWSLGKPAVTLQVNPNNLLEEGRLGLCARGDLRKMAAMIKQYLENDAERQLVGVRCRQYVATHHSPDDVCQRYESLFLLAQSRSFGWRQ